MKNNWSNSSIIEMIADSFAVETLPIPALLNITKL